MNTAKLFQILPDNFFGPLAGKSKIVYWECICLLYRVTSAQLSFGVERDFLVDELVYYFDSHLAADLEEDGDMSAKDSRDKANFMLRRLEHYGWIYVDTDYNYVQRVNFRDYAIHMIQSLLSLEKEDKPEYQGYVYTIYTLTKSASAQPGVALLQIVENTEKLITGLKSLNANIKKYIDELTKYSTIAEIMDALLNDYYTNIVDKAYHRLMTSDNVAKYRPEIIASLESHARSTRFKKTAATEIAQIREISEDEAAELVMNLLHDVIDAFRKMDQILEDINKKNTKYQRAAIGRARFLLSSSEDIKGQLRTILTGLNAQITERGLDYNGIYELEELDRLVKLFSWNFLDMDSLYVPMKGKKVFEPQDVPVVEISDIERAEKMNRMREKLEKTLSAEKINQYVATLLGEKEQMLASEIPLEDMESFIKLIYVRLYGQRKNMTYKLELKQMIEKDGFRFRDFSIRKKT
ncbi:MAG: DUF5716 family protein [Lachnospiraceae bacterium]|nr:DUF5716 family protein [Lachnospiraceae bacterium]